MRNDTSAPRRRPQTGTAARVSKLESRRRAAQSARDRNDDRPLLSVEAAARYLGVSRWTIYRLIDSGELKAHKVGTRYKIRPADIDRYLGLEAS
jgi:excisionase family DNA binding protein